MKKERKKYGSLPRNIVIALDALLAIAIIAFSYRIINTPLGSAALIFGYVMLTLTAALKILQRW